MSETKDDGGPVFPQRDLQPHEAGVFYEGMSLRQWYAGQALIGTCLHSDAYHWSPERIAERAHRIADALLKARKA